MDLVPLEMQLNLIMLQIIGGLKKELNNGLLVYQQDHHMKYALYINLVNQSEIK